MTESDESDDGALCPEISKKLSRGLKEEARKLFMYERSFTHDENGMNWGAGPDDDAALAFAQFVADPGRFVIGSCFDDQFRCRVNLLSSDPLFARTFAFLQQDADVRTKELGGAKNKTKMDFTDPLTAEVFSEVTGMFLHFFWAKQMLKPKRSLDATVGLQRAQRSQILSMSQTDLRDFKGRSLVSLCLGHAIFPTQKRIRDEQTTLNHEEPFTKKNTPHEKPGQRTPGKQRLKLKNPTETCSKCKGAGHTDVSCNIPPGVCLATWTCYLCRGQGHNLKNCPSPHD